MKPLEKANFLILVPIGAYVATIGLYRFFVIGPIVPGWLFGFVHTPETYIIAGLGLTFLTFRWGLFAFPMFLMAANIVELPWLWYLPSINAVQFMFILAGYVLTRPKFKNIAWLLVAILINVPGGIPDFINYHHMAEIAIFAVFLFDIKSTAWPWSAKY